MPRVLDPDVVEKVKWLLINERGLSDNTIAKQTGVSVTYVGEVYKRLNLHRWQSKLITQPSKELTVREWRNLQNANRTKS